MIHVWVQWDRLTFDGISSRTIPNHKSEMPVFAWSLVIPVSLRKVVVKTPETLVRSMAIHVNINCGRGQTHILQLPKQGLRHNYRKEWKKEEVGLADHARLFVFGPADEHLPAVLFYVLVAETVVSALDVGL